MNTQEEIILGPNGFEDLNPIKDRVALMIQNQKRDIVVAVNGSFPNVGKSWLANAMAKVLWDGKQIPLSRITVHHDKPAWFLAALEPFNEQKDSFGAPHGVILLDQFGDNLCHEKDELVQRLRQSYDRTVKMVSEGKFSSVDLWLAIYRSDIPFTEEHILGNFVIENTGATDKSTFR